MFIHNTAYFFIFIYITVSGFVGIIFYVFLISHINTCSRPRSYKEVNPTYYEAACVVLSFLAILTLVSFRYSPQHP